MKKITLMLSCLAIMMNGASIVAMITPTEVQDYLYGHLRNHYLSEKDVIKKDLLHVFNSKATHSKIYNDDELSSEFLFFYSRQGSHQLNVEKFYKEVIVPADLMRGGDYLGSFEDSINEYFFRNNIIKSLFFDSGKQVLQGCPLSANAELWRKSIELQALQKLYAFYAGLLMDKHENQKSVHYTGHCDPRINEAIERHQTAAVKAHETILNELIKKLPNYLEPH